MPMKITLTPSIKRHLKPLPKPVRDEILRRAADACSDGAWLTAEFGDLDFDPWDGSHEKERREIEKDSVVEALKSEQLITKMASYLHNCDGWLSDGTLL